MEFTTIESGTHHEVHHPDLRVSILFLDDEEAILASLRSLFRHEGYDLKLFHEGAEALAFLRTNTVDIIVSDMRMPTMTGIEFLNSASAICPEATRIILSGYEEKEVVITAVAKGLAQHYLMKPWDDLGFKGLIEDSITLQRKLRDQKLKELLSSFSSLPAPPKFHLKLRGMLMNSDNSLKDLVIEIEKSPALVAKLLRVANSVYYGTRKAVSSVREAVLFIGTDYIANLVMAIEAFQTVSGKVSPKSLQLIEVIWEKSLRRATISKLIAEQWPGFKDPNLPYVASLLQDIGYVVRLCSDPDAYRRMIDLISLHGVLSYEADVRVFTIPHDVVGAALLQYWNLPAPIVEGVARHHRLTGDNDLAKIVQIAETLESGDAALPRDPAIQGLAAVWRDKI
jgi:HD-like signal output (HDOD) protein/ActR/RegA family two-component response regulator